MWVGTDSEAVPNSWPMVNFSSCVRPEKYVKSWCQSVNDRCFNLLARQFPISINNNEKLSTQPAALQGLGISMAEVQITWIIRCHWLTQLESNTLGYR